ncbi:MAG: IS200/IS605 family transposase [Chloroflexota bacterium]
MRNFYVCYYHIVWATKYRTPSLTSKLEPIIFDTVRQKSEQLNALIHGINAMLDHIHVAVTIPPSMSVADWTRDIKGISAHMTNREFPDLEETFRWQKGYSVHTFGRKVLPFILAYIKNQKQQHQADTTEDYLEYLETD